MMPVEEYPALLACYRSGQMTDAQLHQHMDADPLFRVWLLEHLRKPEPAE